VTLFARGVSRRRAPVLARSKRIEIAAGRSERVTVKLTGAGRKLVQRHRRVRVTLTVTNIGPHGRVSNTSMTITLRGRGRR
jgi:hypothetical protein